MLGVSGNDLTWGSANFTWDDIEAQAQWEPDGNIAGITMVNKIAPYTGLPSNMIESIPLNGSAVGELGTQPIQSKDVTYGNGRFMQGAFVQDLTQMSWDVNIPAEFNIVFNVSITQPVVDHVVYLTINGPGGYLMVGYDPAAGAFYLEDQLGNRCEAAIQFRLTDWISFGIVQNATTRKLFVTSFGSGAVGDSENAFGPIGNFTTASLYPKLM